MSRKNPGEIYSFENPSQNTDNVKIEIASFAPEPIPMMPELFQKRFDEAQLILKSDTAPLINIKS